MRWLEDIRAEEEKRRQASKVFPLIRVSTRVHQMVRDVEEAASGIATAPVQEISCAYGFVTRHRRALYKYIAELERQAGVKREVNLRFD
jgi:hypothetical protein